MVAIMSLAADRDSADEGFSSKTSRLVYTPAVSASWADGRSFSFHIEHHQLVVEVYRPRLAGPVPQAEDVVATATRRAADIDFSDERSLAAAVRDAVADAQPVPRTSR